MGFIPNSGKGLFGIFQCSISEHLLAQLDMMAIMTYCSDDQSCQCGVNDVSVYLMLICPSGQLWYCKTAHVTRHYKPKCYNDRTPLITNKEHFHSLD